MNNNIIWFRHGLRLHDNPSLLEALKNDNGCHGNVRLFPIFIFDGETAGTKIVGYNRMKFLLEALSDLDTQLREFDGRLLIFRGKPVDIFEKLINVFGIKKICWEQDCEYIWRDRDDAVKLLCQKEGVDVVEKISQTLWDPNEVIDTNGGIPPLTYQMFLHTVSIVGKPFRPSEDPYFENVNFGEIPQQSLGRELGLFQEMPTPENFGVRFDGNLELVHQYWEGGERKALELLDKRLAVESNAFQNGFYLPNQANINLLKPTTSLSAALRFGCLSVRTFYWSIHDIFDQVRSNGQFQLPKGQHITGQLIWREYFYTMSVKNPYYAEMERNPICLNIPWYKPREETLSKWKEGRTGFPLIDATMRQLMAEGWINHILRNVTATFLTRGGLWVSWEEGLKHFLKYLLDADWSVCAGNWMWVSSSAFEKLLDSSKCTCPIALGRRLDPNGDYIKRYIPELRDYPKSYIHTPWKAPEEIQRNSKCLIGIDYPEPMIDLNQASQKNIRMMKSISENLLTDGKTPDHCRPSSVDEIRHFFWLPDEIVVEC